jgi:hypothetical protein
MRQSAFSDLGLQQTEVLSVRSILSTPDRNLKRAIDEY